MLNIEMKNIRFANFGRQRIMHGMCDMWMVQGCLFYEVVYCKVGEVCISAEDTWRVVMIRQY